MTLTLRRLGRLFCCLLTLGALAYAADPNKTLISDTIYRADGSPASGTLLISWPAFVSAEAVFGSKTGNEKKENALNFVASGLGKIIDGTVACLNASTWAKTK
jgi:hypothetical protein